MKNLGFSRLVLVRPHCDPRGGEARRMAVDAADLLERARVETDLDAALCGAQFVVGTTGRIGKHRRPHWRVDRLSPELAAHADAAAELALVFGREDRGLTDVELDRCTHLVHLPASDAYRSYNLAHAVLLVAWELRRAEAAAGVDEDAGELAGHGEREALYHHLEQALRTIGFLNRDGAEVVMRRLRRLLGRARLTCDEAKMLRGVARQVLWIADRAGPPVEDEPDEPDR
jgi:TrmH family RNA methyltransferase